MWRAFKVLFQTTQVIAVVADSAKCHSFENDHTTRGVYVFCS
jgi:hypothetical protein